MDVVAVPQKTLPQGQTKSDAADATKTEKKISRTPESHPKTACPSNSVPPSSHSSLSQPAPQVPAPQVKERTEIAPEDRLRVTVYEEPDLTGLYRVDEAGFITLPLVEAVPAAGLTLTDLAARLSEKFREGYLLNPKITVDRDPGCGGLS
jgi:protein involved in polysaccharide export with SLBB domain